MIIKGIVLFVLLFVVVINARLILENMLLAEGIDEEIVSEANPRLNRTLLEDASSLLENFTSQDLTSIFPSARVENEEVSGPIVVGIQNASGINGAAANVARVLTQQGYQIGVISTAPSLNNQTTVFHKIGRAEESRRLREILVGEGWQVGVIEERGEIPSDIQIVLGK